MKILIVGSGLTGITTAYFLQRQGHEVTVIDRENGAGLGTSFANGGMLTPSMANPWNAPGIWRVLLASLGNPKSPMKLHLHALPSLISWGITFLRNSNSSAFERNTLSNLRLALYSLEMIQSLRQQIEINYDCTTRGTIRIFRDQVAFLQGQDSAAKLTSIGMRIRNLSPAETIDLEPALGPIASQLAGGIHYENDETGDAHQFCVALAEHARQQGVEFKFSTEVQSLEMQSGRIVAVISDQQRFVADRYIIAAGSYSTPLLRKVGIHLPVRPVKGYSVTFDCYSSKSPLRIPVVDDYLHAGVVPLGDTLRVVGTAEFSGYDLSIPSVRIQNLLTLLKTVLPKISLDLATAKPWCGLRAMTADGVPVIGATRIENLLVNTGHGHLGWTMAAGTGQLLADLVNGTLPSIDPTPYALKRFGSN